MNKNPLQKIYYLSGTHWDREWYRAAQGFRIHLSDRINGVLHCLENDPSFTCFMADGQACMLDDFLSFNSDSNERLLTLIAEGRVTVGPFYTMPDEYLSGGESLIRNLLLGHRKAAEWEAEPLKYGYLCDIFGHAAQMPQILNGFHIQGALLGRGTNHFDTPAHFVWRAPSGHECLTFKVPESTGYGSFWHDVFYRNYLEGGKTPLIALAADYVERERERSPIPFVVLMDSMDHEIVHPQATELARQLSERYACPVVFEPLSHLADDLKPFRTEMPVKSGELNKTARDPSEHNKLIAGTLSSRYDIKKANDECQSKLFLTAEPISAALYAHGHYDAKCFLDTAFQYLILNHAHDSICGCSIDDVHRDMHYRFRQAAAIAEEITCKASFWMLPRMAEPLKQSSSPLMLQVYNPLPVARQETIIADIAFPTDYAHHYHNHMPYQQINSFTLSSDDDTDSGELPYQLLGIKKGKVRIPGALLSKDCDLYTIAFDARLGAMGAERYKITPSERPVRYLGSMVSGGSVSENEFIRLTINGDGTLGLYDKRTGINYDNMLRYEDNGEIGDGWHHIPPVNDRVVLSAGAPCTVERIADGPKISRFRITHHLQVPVEIIESTTETVRSTQTETLKISSVITLRAGSPYVEVSTTVENHVRDHRLRLCIPTGTDSKMYYANQAFCFVEREAGFDRSTGNWKEADSAERGFDGIVLRRRAGDGTGLAFISGAGLHECACADDPEASLYITLFRSFYKTWMTAGESDGQLPGTLEFNYWLAPLTGDTSFAELIRMQNRLQSTPISVTTTANAYEESAVSPLCVSPLSLIEVPENDIVVTAIKIPENKQPKTVIIRLCNYSDTETETRIQTRLPIRQAAACDMLEQPLESGMLHNDTFMFETQLTPWEIKTVRVVFE